MGLGGISIWELLIILVIVITIFGTKRLKDIGTDLGGAVRGFRKAMNDAEKDPVATKKIEQTGAQFSEPAAHESGTDHYRKA